MNQDGKRLVGMDASVTVSIVVPEGHTIPAPDMGPLRLFDEDGQEVKPGEPLLPGRHYVLVTADVTAVP